jgi:arylsulfatase
MLRTSRYKLVRYHGIGQGELYDLDTDPGEINNLWNATDHTEAKLTMLEALCDRMAFTMDPLPPRIASA